MIDQSKTRAQMWTAVVMLLLTLAGMVLVAATDGLTFVLAVLGANAATWQMVVGACREDLRVPELAIPADRVVREPLRRRD